MQTHILLFGQSRVKWNERRGGNQLSAGSHLPIWYTHTHTHTHKELTKPPRWRRRRRRQLRAFGGRRVDFSISFSFWDKNKIIFVYPIFMCGSIRGMSSFFLTHELCVCVCDDVCFTTHEQGARTPTNEHTAVRWVGAGRRLFVVYSPSPCVGDRWT
jgi:hypothetical protein